MGNCVNNKVYDLNFIKNSQLEKQSSNKYTMTHSNESIKAKEMSEIYMNNLKKKKSLNQEISKHRQIENNTMMNSKSNFKLKKIISLSNTDLNTNLNSISHSNSNISSKSFSNHSFNESSNNTFLNSSNRISFSLPKNYKMKEKSNDINKDDVTNDENTKKIKKSKTYTKHYSNGSHSNSVYSYNDKLNKNKYKYAQNFIKGK